VHERVGHLTHYEIPDKVAEDIRGFVSGLNQPNNRRKNRPGESGATFGS
jgi:hypothetical protein